MKRCPTCNRPMPAQGPVRVCYTCKKPILRWHKFVYTQVDGVTTLIHRNCDDPRNYTTKP